MRLVKFAAPSAASAFFLRSSHRNAALSLLAERACRCPPPVSRDANTRARTAVCRTLLPTPPRLSKEERRQLFALEVQQRDQEEALRRQFMVPPPAAPPDPQGVVAALPQQGFLAAPPPGMVAIQGEPLAQRETADWSSRMPQTRRSVRDEHFNV